jgi:hypothetical protein
MSKSKVKKDFFEGVKEVASTSGQDVLNVIETACKKSGQAIGTNEIAMLLNTTSQKIRVVLQKIRKKGGAESRARQGSVEVNGKTLQWRDVRDKRGVLYALTD